MAQACGEAPFSPLAFIPGVDFDPSDAVDVESVLLASEWDRDNSIQQLRDENARLRSDLSDLYDN